MGENLSCLPKIDELLSYIRTSNPDPMALCQFLVLRTFEEIKPKSVHFQRIEPDGRIVHFAQFGFSQGELDSWSTITVNDQVPSADAIKHNDMVWLADRENWIRDYPNVVAHYLPPDAQTYATWPVTVRGHYMTLIGLTLNQSLPLTPELRSCLEIVGGLVGLHLSMEEVAAHAQAREVTPWDLLTRRHRDILAMIADGLTNVQIATELGFSESTIRQDTIKIYEILGVSGRKEAAKAYRSRPRDLAS